MYQKAPGGTASVPASSVTVSLSPEDAAKLIKAITASKLYLTLRNDKDHTPVATVDVTSLFVKPPAAKGGGDAMAALPPPSALPPPPLPNAPDAGPITGVDEWRRWHHHRRHCTKLRSGPEAKRTYSQFQILVKRWGTWLAVSKAANEFLWKIYPIDLPK
ncbi:MAG: hypothetical protein IPP97_27785 [Candidatus Obscuribacter sp.]|nr:hypothetical protein [Candidatus Obscuribacter sp.]